MKLLIPDLSDSNCSPIALFLTKRGVCGEISMKRGVGFLMISSWLFRIATVHDWICSLCLTVLSVLC